jgi:cell wall-associated NlpC family hydrolase
MRSLAVLHLLVVAVLMAGLLAITPASGATEARRAHRIAHAVQIVAAQQGDPYRYGSAGPNAFDCSGLVYYSYRRAGISVPRTSDALARATRRVSRSNLHRGDLVFFHQGGNVYHVGVFAGVRDGRRTILHAPRTGQRVKRERIWTDSWFAGTLR